MEELLKVWAECEPLYNHSGTRARLAFFVCDSCTQRCYPAQLLVLQGQHPGALCEQFHLDSRQRVCGGEVPLGPPADRHNKRHTGG